MIRRLAKEVEKVGGLMEIQLDGEVYSIQIRAPFRKVWNCDCIHSIRAEYDKCDIEEKKQCIIDCIERIRLGIEECGGAECEICFQI